MKYWVRVRACACAVPCGLVAICRCVSEPVSTHAELACCFGAGVDGYNRTIYRADTNATLTEFNFKSPLSQSPDNSTCAIAAPPSPP